MKINHGLLSPLKLLQLVISVYFILSPNKLKLNMLKKRIKIMQIDYCLQIREIFSHYTF